MKQQTVIFLYVRVRVRWKSDGEVQKALAWGLFKQTCALILWPYWRNWKKISMEPIQPLQKTWSVHIWTVLCSNITSFWEESKIGVKHNLKKKRMWLKCKRTCKRKQKRKLDTTPLFEVETVAFSRLRLQHALTLQLRKPGLEKRGHMPWCTQSRICM